MNIEELRDFCMALKGARENMPWTEPQYSMLVTFTVGGKWFCLLDMDKKFIDVKCSPDKIQDMQSHYRGAFPAWHMNKEHWLGVTLESDIPDTVIKELLTDGYILIVARLPKAIREELK